jgi:hypothetical protein
MKRTNEISKPKLFIEELELPQIADAEATTLAIGEESGGKIPGKITTEAVGEESFKTKIKR